MRMINLIVVHHSAGPDTETAAQIKAFHTAPTPKGRGWSDIGYHYVVRRLPSGAWTVEEGRPLERAGAHDDGQNTNSIGVCICGDYTKGPVPRDAWLILLGTLVGLCKRFNLTALQIEGHKENEPPTTPTACPGFNPADLRAAVAPLL